jgi:hypothetical protein
MAANKSNIYMIPEGSPVAPDKYDVRVRNRHISGGVITFEGLKKHLENLPDDTEHAELRSYDAIVNDDSVETADVVAGAPEGGSTTH